MTRAREWTSREERRRMLTCADGARAPGGEPGEQSGPPSGVPVKWIVAPPCAGDVRRFERAVRHEERVREYAMRGPRPSLTHRFARYKRALRITFERRIALLPYEVNHVASS